MADARFFKVARPFSLRELAGISDAEISGEADPDRQFSDVEPLANAGPGHISFIDNRRYLKDFEQSKAGAVLAQADLASRAPPGMALLICADPYRGYARVAQAFYPATRQTTGISGSAQIAPSASIGADCAIDAGVVIGEDAEIGEGCWIGANSTLGDGIVLGPKCRIGPNVSLAFCLIGAGAVLHSGVRIGGDGFGFAPGATGHEKVPQLGRVIIQDDVEIGSNSTIDRGSGPDTVIGAGCKIDNLVQIGHNVHMGKGCLIVSQVGISGSSRLGDMVMIGGQAGVAGHLTIGPGARIAAQSGVTRNIDGGETVAGMPAENSRKHWRKVARLNRLAEDDGGRNDR
ncbi:MAG: UDP-3-O-(3-hydroxymyristoyl)glucosamine N-acyltransferase [Rhodospirillales bacterium]|nr:UDP-3-O-(3-hydroxymyristoyl)glucosamine N-acyltransferase [Rhodospirillales bacterium]